MLLISKKTLSFLVFLSALVIVHNVRWLTHLDGVVVSSSCICVNLLVWTHAPFMHSAKHPKVGREGNFCSHPVHPSYTRLTLFVLHMVHVSWSTIASYSPCIVDLVLLTLISLFILDWAVEKAVLCYYITIHIVYMRTTSFVIVISYYTRNKIM